MTTDRYVPTAEERETAKLETALAALPSAAVCVNSQPHGSHRIAGTWRDQCPGLDEEIIGHEPEPAPAATPLERAHEAIRNGDTATNEGVRRVQDCIDILRAELVTADDLGHIEAHGLRAAIRALGGHTGHLLAESAEGRYRKDHDELHADPTSGAECAPNCPEYTVDAPRTALERARQVDAIIPNRVPYASQAVGDCIEVLRIAMSQMHRSPAVYTRGYRQALEDPAAYTRGYRQALEDVIKDLGGKI